MNFAGRDVQAVSKNYEVCIKYEELCIKNEEFCINNDEFCSAHNSYTRGVKTEPDKDNYGVRVNLLSFLEWWKSCRKKKQRAQVRFT